MTEIFQLKSQGVWILSFHTWRCMRTWQIRGESWNRGGCSASSKLESREASSPLPSLAGRWGMRCGTNQACQLRTWTLATSSQGSMRNTSPLLSLLIREAMSAHFEACSVPEADSIQSTPRLHHFPKQNPSVGVPWCSPGRSSLLEGTEYCLEEICPQVTRISGFCVSNLIVFAWETQKVVS